MAVGYKYREIENFLDLDVGREWATAVQLSLDIADSDDSVHSVIRFLGESDHPRFWKYHVEHETVRPIKVRFANQRRNSVITIQEFHLFLAKDKKYLYADTTDVYCDELLERVSKGKNDFVSAQRQVDLAKMRQQLGMNVRGGWFRDLHIADVSVAAIFGANVAESEDWQRYEQSGKISALTLELTYSDAKHSIQVSQTGGVVLYDKYSEQDALEFVETMWRIIGPYSEVKEKRHPEKPK